MSVIYLSCFLLSIVPLIIVWFYQATILGRKKDAVLNDVRGVSFEESPLTASRYQGIEKTIETEFKEEFGHHRLLIPTLVLFFFYSIGFFHIGQLLNHTFQFKKYLIFPPAYLDALLPSLLAFIGAYLFNLGYSVRRIFVADLSHNVFWASINRVLLAVGLAVVIDLGVTINGNSLSKNWYFVFFSIGFLSSSYLKWILAQAQSHLKFFQPTNQNLGLRNISGITFWIESRLEQEGIETIQNLATSDPVSLAVKTQYELYTLVDWIDQAVLLDRLGEKALILRNQGFISGAIDFAWVSPENTEEIDTAEAVANLLDVEKIFVIGLMDNLFQDAQVQALWTLWQSRFNPGRREKPHDKSV